MKVSHNLHMWEFDGAARLVISRLRETDERDPQFKLLGLSSRSAWEAYKHVLQLGVSDGFDPLGDFVYGRCQDLANSLPDFVLREWWRTSEFPYRFGEPPDMEEMREAVSDEVWYSVNDWAEQEPPGEDWS